MILLSTYPETFTISTQEKPTFHLFFLMNEVHWVLKPNGIFYAVTPAHPHQKSFADPSHVNFITQDTHTYFCGDAPLGRMDGFQRSFDAVRVTIIRPRGQYEPIDQSPLEIFQRLKDRLKMR